jgi:small conductance mechanosensitive channel
MFQSTEEIIDSKGGLGSLLSSFSLEDTIAGFANDLVDFCVKVLIAVLVFYVGKFIIKKIYKICRTVMITRRTDASLTTFVLSVVKITLYFILIVTVIGILGVETSSFLALFASAGVAIGMALSGTLQNFAGGVLILLLKPYRVGDYIEAEGYSGTVKAIQIFHTVINTVDNKAIIIPNGGLSTGSVNNYSLEEYRRVDWTIGLSYGDDFDRAAEVIRGMLLEDYRVVEKYIDEHKAAMKLRAEQNGEPEENSLDTEEPADDVEVEKNHGFWSRFFHRHREHNRMMKRAIQAKLDIKPLPKADCSPFVGLNELADSSINITVRAWTRSSDYWGLYFDMNRRFYTELPQKGFAFPFPQMDVHIAK